MIVCLEKCNGKSDLNSDATEQAEFINYYKSENFVNTLYRCSCIIDIFFNVTKLVIYFKYYLAS